MRENDNNKPVIPGNFGYSGGGQNQGKPPRGKTFQYSFQTKSGALPVLIGCPLMALAGAVMVLMFPIVVVIAAIRRNRIASKLHMTDRFLRNVESYINREAGDKDVIDVPFEEINPRDRLDS